MCKAISDQTIIQLCEDYCNNIENIREQSWVIVPLILHVVYYKPKIPIEIIEQKVKDWFNSLY